MYPQQDLRKPFWSLIIASLVTLSMKLKVERFRKRTDTDMITVSVHVGRASDFVSQTHNKDSAVPWQNPPKSGPNITFYFN